MTSRCYDNFTRSDVVLATHSVYKCEDVVVLCGESAPECHLSIV